MDNYFHPAALMRLTIDLVAIPSDTNMDFDQIASVLSRLLTEARSAARATGFDFRPDEHNGRAITGTKVSACKRIICAYIIRHMEAAELDERAVYVEDGREGSEVREWIGAIQAHL